MSQEATKKFSSKQEKMVADALGGYVVGGSGAMPAVPGDVKTYDWLVECKTHTEPGHPIFFDSAVWAKIKNEAMATQRKPVLIVDDGSQKEENTWCLCKSMNLNLVNVIVGTYPAAIRKNISCKNEKLKAEIDKQSKGAIGEFYIGAGYELSWEGDDVCLLPLSVFKEIFEK